MGHKHHLCVFFSRGRLGQWPGVLGFFLRLPPPGATDHVIQLPSPLSAPDSLPRLPICGPAAAAAAPWIRPADAANGEFCPETAPRSDWRRVHRCAENSRPVWVRAACFLGVSEHSVCSVCGEAGHLFNWILDCSFDVFLCRNAVSDLLESRQSLLFSSCRQLIRKSDNRPPITGPSLCVYFAKEVVFFIGCSPGLVFPFPSSVRVLEYDLIRLLSSVPAQSCIFPLWYKIIQQIKAAQQLLGAL